MLPLLAALAMAQPQARTLTVSPAAEPRPALRYELLPSHRDKQSGNAALAYSRAFAALPKPPSDFFAAKEQEDAFEKWMTDPLDQLPKDGVRTYLDQRKRVLRELDVAATADHCDWGSLPRLKADGLDALPEVSPTRQTMRLLTLRARLELAEDRFDDAARTLRAGFLMAKHVGEGPTYIQMLVGMALGYLALERVEDWIGRPVSPNLYWALTNLPRPLVDPWPGFHGEDVFVEGFMPTLTRLRAGPVSKKEAGGIVDEVLAAFRRVGGGIGGPDPMEAALRETVGRLGAAGFVAERFPAARKDLLALGRTEADVDKMPPAQVVFLAPLERADLFRDEYRKWLGVPYHRARPELKKLTARVKAEIGNGSDPLFGLCTQSLSTTENMIWGVARADRRVQFLRVVEAIRLHAAAHGGTPPAKLANVTAVPVPDDPITGRPFGYKVNGNVIVLIGRPPAGDRANEMNSFRYEITVRRP